MHLTNATPNLVRQHKFSIISRLKLLLLQDHMVVSCNVFLSMLVFFFYHIHEGFCLLPPHLPASPIRRVFAAFVLGQMHPVRDGPCTSPYAAAVIRRVGVELGRIEDLCAPHECNAQSCEAAQILYNLPAQVICIAGSHGCVLH